MKLYSYTTEDGFELIISACDTNGHYNVQYDSTDVGYLYYRISGEENLIFVWTGTTLYLRKHAIELGMFIEDCIMSL